MLASPDETLVAHGAKAVLRVSSSDLADQVPAFLAARRAFGGTPVLVGALPFDRRQPAHLFEPFAVRHTRGASAMRPSGWRTASAPERRTRYRVTARPSRAEYERAVAQALSRMAPGAGGESGITDASGRREALLPKDALLRKVVLARSLMIEASEPLDVQAVFERLCVDPRITAFSLPLPYDGRRDRVLVGATPELLLKREGNVVSSTPLAGSARRQRDPAEDRRAGEALLESTKDLHEHAAVVDWIADRLARYCETLTVDARPMLVSTRSMWHLGTRIVGTLRQPAPSSLELAALLHPTPAVCGVPLELARDTIRELEPFDRGFFAGAVGWCAANGDGRWLVAIRCAQIAENSAQLFAGAGIVPDSRPELEADETSAKFSALLEALALDEQGRETAADEEREEERA